MVFTESDEARLKPWLGLLRAPGIGPGLGANLLQRFAEPGAILDADPRSLKEAGVPAAALRWLERPDSQQLEADLAWLAHADHHLVTLDDPRYPERLKQIARPPLALFCIGDPALLQAEQLAIVGSRNPSGGGKEHAYEFAAELARCGLVIGSGMATGIDAAAHEGALSATGYTVAVCGTGVDRVYPAHHHELAQRIAEKGLLVSEFPLGTPALAEHFPRRNRIISGLALGVLVVEAAQRSGSLITARLAMEQGREVFAIPGSVHNPLARGCHRIIREGAKLIETAADILEELAPLVDLTPVAETEPAIAQAPEMDDEYHRLLQAMGHEPRRVDELVERSGLTADAVSSMLLILELQGRIASAPGGTYTRTTA